MDTIFSFLLQQGPLNNGVTLLLLIAVGLLLAVTNYNISFSRCLQKTASEMADEILRGQVREGALMRELIENAPDKEAKRRQLFDYFKKQNAMPGRMSFKLAETMIALIEKREKRSRWGQI